MDEIWRFGSTSYQKRTVRSDTAEYQPVELVQTVRANLYGGVFTCGMSMKIGTNNRCRDKCDEEGMVDVFIVVDHPVGGQTLRYQWHLYCLSLKAYFFIFQPPLYSLAIMPIPRVYSDLCDIQVKLGMSEEKKFRTYHPCYCRLARLYGVVRGTRGIVYQCCGDCCAGVVYRGVASLSCGREFTIPTNDFTS